MPKAVLHKALFLLAPAATSALSNYTITRVANGSRQSCITTGNSCTAQPSPDGKLGSADLSFDIDFKTGAGTGGLVCAASNGTSIGYNMTLAQQDQQSWLGNFALQGSWQVLEDETLDYNSSSKMITHNTHQTCNAPLVDNCCYAPTQAGLDQVTICYFGDYFTLKSEGSPGVSYKVSASNGWAAFTLTPGLFSNESMTITNNCDTPDVPENCLPPAVTIV